MRPITVTVGPLATASANNIAQSQTPTNTVTLNGSSVTAGKAQLITPRRVLITTADTTHTFTITGTSASGVVQSEPVIGVAGTAQSALDYLTVTSITLVGTATAAVQAGTSGVASTPWVRLDEWAFPQVGIQCDAVATISYTVQTTYDDPNSPTTPVAPYLVNWFSSTDAAAVNATGSIQSVLAYSPTFARVILNSGTGSVTATFVQYGVVDK